MGWASYREDILSRQVRDRRSKRVQEPQDAAARAAAAGSPLGGEPGKQKRATAGRAKPVGGADSLDIKLPPARIFPVLLLADTSGSMKTDGKIGILNAAVREMIATFADEDSPNAAISVGVVTFGRDGAKWHTRLTPADEVAWHPMPAAGKTPLGEALTLVRDCLEDESQIPRTAYRPTMVLVSDGIPTDEWQSPLSALLASDRASKATRFAVAIGDDANREMLKTFVSDAGSNVFEAHDAREITKFFRWLSMSVSMRSRGINSAATRVFEPTVLDEWEF